MRLYEDLGFEYTYFVDPYKAPVLTNGIVDEFTKEYFCELAIYLKYLKTESSSWEFNKVQKVRKRRHECANKLKKMVQDNAEYFI